MDPACPGRETVAWQLGDLCMFGLIVTERLQLKRIVHSDAAHIAELLTDDRETIQMTEDLPDPCTLETANEWVRLRLKPGENVFAIQRYETGDFMGCVGIKQDGAVVNLGYWIGRPYWNNGYATEAAWSVVRNARTLGITEVQSEVFVENTASARVLEKLGFQNVGQIEKDIPQRGGMRLLNTFQLTHDSIIGLR
ncbi:MAG TPA: N-acetyltransferase [Nitrospirales bacterium]|nr:N-acetyltransferase [Nitrospirales bacterium]HIC04678.1 N-acetyltransferase [Nitrospirales bacterium]HIO69256.1 N-acetyltransferase [Nitrospirales bacterium]